MPESKGVFTRLREWLAGQFIGDVPGEIAQCEFGCRKGQCTSGEWESCMNRNRTISRLAPAPSGEKDE